MCDHCGCGKPDNNHSHDHDHHHDHPHTHDHDHEVRTITLEQKVLARNDEAASRNREWLAERGVVAVNMISAPGTGKTLLLERTLEGLRDRIGCAVIAGDQQTDNDARRLSGKGAEVVQIETHDACHLDAVRVGEVLPDVIKDGIRLLFIENVGNLVCPAAFDLGENFKVALLSVTEGEDKPEKYPKLFIDSQVVVITKVDLAEHVEWDESACRKSIQKVHPGVFTFELSAKTGRGMDAWMDYLSRLVV